MIKTNKALILTVVNKFFKGSKLHFLLVLELPPVSLFFGLVLRFAALGTSVEPKVLNV
jgi:hypothetical protein